MGAALALKPVEALAELVARLRDAARQAQSAALKRDLERIADELLTIRKAVMGEPDEMPGYNHKTPDYLRQRKCREKNPAPGLRQCSKCGETRPVSMFTVTDARTGKRRADCRDCYNAGQRTRYVSAGFRVVAVELMDGDPCVGHLCPSCGHPFEVGQRVQGENVRHEGCEADQ